MSFTFGFYNSDNHDRIYDAEQFSSVFDGIINDGVYQSIGDKFHVTAVGNMNVTVGTGRAWFDHTWSYNSTPYTLTLEENLGSLPRIDVIVLEVNKNVGVRMNALTVVKGIASASPVRPSLVVNDTVHQYALATVRINASSSAISQADITQIVGNDETPFVTGIIETASIESRFVQWQSQWENFFNAETSTDEAEFSNWMDVQNQLYNDWFDSLQEILDTSDDRIVNLQAEIENIKNQIGHNRYEMVLTGSDGLPIVSDEGSSDGDRDDDPYLMTEVSYMLRDDTYSTEDMFFTKTYEYQYSIAANGSIIITGVDMGLVEPVGYDMLMLRSIDTGSENVVISSFSGVTGDISLKNTAGSATGTLTLSVKVLYAKEGSLA